MEQWSSDTFLPTTAMRLPFSPSNPFDVVARSISIEYGDSWTTNRRRSYERAHRYRGWGVYEKLCGSSGAKWMQRDKTTTQRTATRTSMSWPGLVRPWRSQGWPLPMFCGSRGMPSPYESNRGWLWQSTPTWHVTPPFRIFTVGPPKFHTCPKVAKSWRCRRKGKLYVKQWKTHTHDAQSDLNGT